MSVLTSYPDEVSDPDVPDDPEDPETIPMPSHRDDIYVDDPVSHSPPGYIQSVLDAIQWYLTRPPWF